MNQSLVTQSLPSARHYHKLSSAEKVPETGKRSINPPIKRLNLSQSKSQTDKAANTEILKGENTSPLLSSHRGSTHTRLFNMKTSAAYSRTKPIIHQYATATFLKQAAMKEKIGGTPKQNANFSLTTFTAKKPQRNDQKLVQKVAKQANHKSQILLPPSGFTQR